MPSVGLGTWRSDKEKVGSAVENAIIRNGYRHIDCASIYGNENEVGEALNSIITSGEISREELFITSKLWNTEHHPDHVEAACLRSLKDLHLSYVDLYLVHWGIAFPHGKELEPMGNDGIVKTQSVSVRETWQAMETLVEKGLVKAIGVANFTCPMIVDLLSYAKIKPSINQIEVHPYNTQEELVGYCSKRDIQITAYSPLGSSGVSGHKPIHDEVVIRIGKKHKKSPAQILVRWSLQRGLIPIPKSTNLHRLAENIQVYDFKLSIEEMGELNKLNRNQRYVDPIEWWGIPYFQ